MGWKNGINLRDTLTQRAAIENRLEIRNTSIAVPRSPITASSSPSTGNISGFDPLTWFLTATGNLGGSPRQSTDMGFSANLWNLNNTNDPIPLAGTEAVTAGTSYQGRLSGDAWFDSVSYRGAFDPTLPRNQQWDWSWANYDPQNYDPETEPTSVETVDHFLPDEFALKQNYPNPFNPSTIIGFSLPSSGNITMIIYSLLGEEIITLVDEYKQAGTYEIHFDGSALSSGTYFYTLKSNNRISTKRMLLVK